MQGPLRRFARERLAPHDDAKVPSAWVTTERKADDLAGLSWLTKSAPPAGQIDPRSPVLVMLGAEDGEAFRELVSHANAVARVYVLVSSGWGKGQIDQCLLQAPTVLIRRLPDVPATAFYGPNGARLWLGGSWSLRLDSGQAEALRQTFLRLFWHDAIEEAWTGGRQLPWRVAGSRPFDVPELPATASLRLATADARLSVDADSTFIHLTGGQPPDCAARRLWFPTGGDHHARLSALARRGTEVVWEKRGLPDMAVGPRGGEVLLSSPRARLRVVLTSAQAADVSRLLTAEARWSFRVDVRIGDPAVRTATFWLPDENASRGLDPEQSIAIPDVSAPTLRAVPECSPSSFPPPQPLALSARYRWTVVPPRVPAGAQLDALHGRWEEVDKDWRARVGKVREALDSANAERGRLSKGLSRLLSALLGFERTAERLLVEVATLEEQRPSACSPSNAQAMVAKLTNLEEDAHQLLAGLREAERKAHEDEAREKQEAAWRERVSAAERELPAQRAALEAASALRAKVEAELKDTEESLRDAPEEAKKDIGAKLKKLRDDHERARGREAGLRNEIEALERTRVEQFQFQPPPAPQVRSPQTGPRFVPQKAVTALPAQIPEEALPEVGQLRTFKGKRYLVIKTWEELDAAEQAASRLGAELVAPEDA